MNINSLLTRFAQEDLVLSYNQNERNKIDISLTRLENVLSDRLGDSVLDFIRFGSYTRNTILPRRYDPESDVDLLVLFDKENYDYSHTTYHKWILDTLTNAYPLSISKRSHPVVKLELNHIMFDVVPAYYENSFWTGQRFFIPDKKYGWKDTFPNDINSSLSQKNQSYGGNIVRNVVRLCKHWNAMYGYPYESYLMEKEIISTFFWYGDDLYTKFLSVLDNIAGNYAGVRQALDSINRYKGSFFEKPDVNKQIFWLKKLLPGLQDRY